MLVLVLIEVQLVLDVSMRKSCSAEWLVELQVKGVLTESSWKAVLIPGWVRSLEDRCR